MAFVVKKAVLATKTVEHGEEWREYQPGVKLLIRGLQHKIVAVGVEMMGAKQRDIRARFEAGDISALNDGSTADQLNVRMLADLVVADWEGFVGEDNEALECTPETVLAVLRSEPDLGIWVVGQAGEISKAARERLEEIQGKPSTATAGKKNGSAKPKNGA